MSKIQLRDYQVKIILDVEDHLRKGIKHIAVNSPTGSGKCWAYGTKMIMLNGTIEEVQNIKVGDILLGPDSKQRKVEVVSNGNEMMYEIIPVKGKSFTVNESHILSLKLTPTNKGERCKAGNGKWYIDNDIVNLTVLEYINSTKTFKHRAKLWRTGVEFKHSSDQILPPYLLGIWLGDGTSIYPAITTGEDVLIDYIYDYANKTDNLHVRKQYQEDNKSDVYHLISDNKKWGGNIVRNALKFYNIKGNKHIPQSYKIASREQRLELLAGIIDTDGSLQENTVEITTKFELLRDDILFLVRSLGLAAYYSDKYVKGKLYYRISISGNLNVIPNKISRKKASQRKQIKSVLVTGFKIKQISTGNYYGFTLSGNDSLLLLDDFTVNHNTFSFASIVKEHQLKGERVLVLTHRKELLLQTGGAFNRLGIKTHSLTAETQHVPMGNVVVGMIETVYRRITKNPSYNNFLHSIDMIIIDEAHEGLFDKMFQYFTKQIVIGFSATLYRRNPKTPLSTFYEKLVHGPSVKFLVKNNYLAPSLVYGTRLDMSNIGKRGGEYKAEEVEVEFDAQNMYANVERHYNQLLKGKKTLIFAPTVTSSITLVNRLNKAGIKSIHVDGETPKELRKQIFNEFDLKDDAVLSNVGIAVMGFDQPDIEGLVLFLATTSLVKYLQMLGRGARTSEGKTNFTVLDYGGNTSRFGLYEEEREFSLENDLTTFKKETSMTKICPECNAIVPMSTVKCRCGYVWTKQRTEQLIEEIKVDLIPLNGFAVQEYAQGKSFEELDIIREIKGYKKYWIKHQLQTLDDLKMFGTYMNYKKGWFDFAKASFKPTTIEQRKEEYDNYINGLNR